MKIKHKAGVALAFGVSALAIATPGYCSTASESLDGAAQAEEGAAQSQVPPSTPTSSEQASAIGDIVVTAQRREESLQRVPVTVTAFGEAAIAQRQLKNLSDIAIQTPSLNVGVRNGILLPFLRGVGSTSSTLGVEASVTVYLDGVYFARLPGAFFSLQNLSRVEVLKGPQGTLFGRNASGGVIQLVTKDPTSDPSFKISGSYANKDTFEGSFYASTGLGDNAAIDIAATGRKQNEGFGRNVTTGHRNVFDDHYLVSSKLVWEPTDATKVTLNGFYNWSKTGTIFPNFPGTISGYSTPPFGQLPRVGFWDDQSEFDQRFTAEVWGGYLKVAQDLSFARITSITSYSQIKERFLIDLDYSARNDGRSDLRTLTEQFTQELQIGSLSNSDRLQWIAGLYYFDNRAKYNPASFRGTVATFGGSDNLGMQKSLSYAGYAQATYEFIPRLSFTGGIRYTKDKVNADGVIYAPNSTAILLDRPASSFETNKVTYKVGVDYKPTDRILVYTSYSRGFKEGNYGILYYTSTEPSRPEQLDAYEVGFKSELFDRRLRLNGALFYYDLKNPQVQIIQIGSVITSNAGAARVKGAEFDSQFAITPRLIARISASYLDAKYTDYKNAPSAPQNPLPPFGAVKPALAIDASGMRTPLAPKFTYNLGLDYSVDTALGELSLSGDYSHNSGYFFEPNNFLRQGPFGLLSGRVGLKPNDSFGVSIWGKNLTNEKYITNAGALTGPAGFLYSPAPGRTYGVTIDMSF